MKKTVNKHMPELEINTDPDLSDFDYECSYNVSHASPDLVSVDLNFYSFTGGAHGNAWTAPFNYRLTENGPKEITINNLFGKKPHLKALQAMLRPKLMEELYPDDERKSDEWIDRGTESLDDLNCISIGKEGITFNFQQYQVACYAAGAPSILLTYDELKPLFDKTSPVFAYVHNSASHVSSHGRQVVAELK